MLVHGSCVHWCHSQAIGDGLFVLSYYLPSNKVFANSGNEAGSSKDRCSCLLANRAAHYSCCMCSKRALPLTKYCSNHILHDGEQLLFGKCNTVMSQSIDSCPTPTLSSTGRPCTLHSLLEVGFFTYYSPLWLKTFKNKGSKNSIWSKLTSLKIVVIHSEHSLIYAVLSLPCTKWPIIQRFGVTESSEIVEMDSSCSESEGDDDDEVEAPLLDFAMNSTPNSPRVSKIKVPSPLPDNHHPPPPEVVNGMFLRSSEVVIDLSVSSRPWSNHILTHNIPHT